MQCASYLTWYYLLRGKEKTSLQKTKQNKNRKVIKLSFTIPQIGRQCWGFHSSLSAQENNSTFQQSKWGSLIKVFTEVPAGDGSWGWWGTQGQAVLMNSYHPSLTHTPLFSSSSSHSEIFSKWFSQLGSSLTWGNCASLFLYTKWD